jgi:hypothetical protein
MLHTDVRLLIIRVCYVCVLVLLHCACAYEQSARDDIEALQAEDKAMERNFKKDIQEVTFCNVHLCMHACSTHNNAA